MKKRRAHVPSEVETSVLVQSARRCAICFALGGDGGEKRGQVAHLDRDPTNWAEENLAFLCQDHHSLFDSTTSQHKNYTIAEVKAYRTKLYSAISSGEHRAPVAEERAVTRSSLERARLLAVQAVVADREEKVETEVVEPL